jgi:hypothetical protein
MQVSAEIRYFWRGATPGGLEEWFRGCERQPFPAGGGESRLDEYHRDANQTELSIKRRGEESGVEVKGLVALSGEHLQSPFTGQVEIWAKWGLLSLELGRNTIAAIDKKRWLRKFDTRGTMPIEIALDASEKPLGDHGLPDDGCNAELTKLRLVNSDVWWTLGLEAFGTLWTVEKNLKLGAEALAARDPPDLRPEVIASYPSWLSKHVL